MQHIDNAVKFLKGAWQRIVTATQGTYVHLKARLNPPKPAYRLMHNAKQNYQICTFWVSEPMLTGHEDVLSFRSPRAQERKQSPLVKELFAIKGIDYVELVSYEIRVGRAEIYSWKELIKPVEAAIRKHLTEMTADKPFDPTKFSHGEDISDVVDFYADPEQKD